MDVITKIGELKTPSTEKIKNYFTESIYTFGETIHAFANDTKDKVRFNFIFEIQE